ncbi:glutathione-disulfide reductase [Pseudorhodoferax sp. Leaf274]|uniref:glutathione-disulfide reductase n=1 Tax=Pseudorhodoferax sp. Leaf274 TaxID=1736318 RepID=UPI000703446D|nr:glutathione-disulfide reductase [Pseudorhodoferax sp. Leaf274]KQP47674.1 glutathione reductase [Pseudorhodoferax sp. Leaf274]
MDKFDHDLLVLGGGSGGVRAARMAAQRGARVALVEAAALGGTCVNVGCIPKKLYSYAAGYAEAFEEAAGFGWNVPAPRFDWATLKANRAKEIGRLNGIYRDLLKASGAEVVEGWGMLSDAHTVQVGTRRLTARHILVATGGTPFVPEIAGRELALISDQMFDLDPFPKRLAVVGGGYIACEFASIFRKLGAEVTQLQRGGRILSSFDQDISRFLASEMGKTGIDLRLNAQVEQIVRQGKGLHLTLADGSLLDVDAVLFATGRRPNTANIGLEALGVQLQANGAVAVDAHYRSSVPSIFALGDVSTSMPLTPVATAEAMALVDHLLGPAPGKAARSVSYDHIPTAVFTHPPVGTVGYTEEAARARFGRVTVFRTEFKPLRHTLSGSSERTLMKLVVDDASDRVVGLHMVGADAGEIVQGFAVALRAGATKAVFDSTIGIHPTAAEEFVTLREPAPE